MRKKRVSAVCCADLHLSLKPPLARAGEEDWLEAQKRAVYGIIDASTDHGGVPIFCAGDIFDRWNSPPELINWAIQHLPEMHAIPGQHDLPLHNLDNIHKSAYWTLVEAGKIHHLDENSPQLVNGLEVTGFPWGIPLIPLEHSDGRVKIALVHQYVWMTGHSYPGAPKDGKVNQRMKALRDWDAVIFGDNHKGFHAQRAHTDVFNCGTLMRRKSDEINYKPQVGLIYDDGTIEPHYLDTSADKITVTESPRTPEEDMELKEFLEELTKLQDSTLDFEQAVKEVLAERKPSAAVQKLILEAME